MNSETKTCNQGKKLQIEYQVFNLGSNKALIEVTFHI